MHIYRNQCIKKLSAPTSLEQLALNGIIWVHERNGRNYNCIKAAWKTAIKEIKSKYKVEGHKEYKDIDNISETLLNDTKEGEL